MANRPHADYRGPAGLVAAKPSAVGTRKDIAIFNGALSERGLDIAEGVKNVAADLGKSPSQVAIAWTLLNDAVSAPIVGARTLAQLEDNLGALDVVFGDAHRAQLEAASAIELGFPHDFLKLPLTRSVVFGDVKIATRR